ncbi:hypothetical protein B9037_007665 [Klebsiella aerogenes]|nr:hypothetical protein B9037_007665 [Klebsiella aerogenes]
MCLSRSHKSASSGKEEKILIYNQNLLIKMGVLLLTKSLLQEGVSHRSAAANMHLPGLQIRN